MLIGTLTENAKETNVEKPDEPETPPPEIPEETQDFDIPDNAVNMAAPTVGGNLQVGLGSFSRDSDYIPVYIPQPQYPRRAQTRGKEGYAVGGGNYYHNRRCTRSRDGRRIPRGLGIWARRSEGCVEAQVQPKSRRRCWAGSP